MLRYAFSISVNTLRTEGRGRHLGAPEQGSESEGPYSYGPGKAMTTVGSIQEVFETRFNVNLGKEFFLVRKAGTKQFRSLNSDKLIGSRLLILDFVNERAKRSCKNCKPSDFRSS